MSSPTSGSSGPAVPVDDTWTSAAESAERPPAHDGDSAAARPPRDESARELQETVRSISRLEEAN